MKALALRYRGPFHGIRIDAQYAGAPLAVGDTVTIGDAPVLFGRGALAEVLLPCERIARRHASLRQPEPGRLVLEDLGGTNQTQLNGANVLRAELRAGDELGIGDACGFDVVEVG